MKRAGFTMIELIFVIVILGILAAVAVPKLAATREDAKVSAEVTSAKQALQNLGAQWVSQGNWTNYSPTMAGNSVKCFTIAASGTDGNVTIQTLGAASTDCPAGVLSGVNALAIEGGIVDTAGTAKMYQFGGVGVRR